MKQASFADFILGILLALGIFVAALWGVGRHNRNLEVAAAQQNQYLVQAIVDFRAARGWLPATLEDLVPEFLPQVPQQGRLYYRPRSLLIRVNGWLPGAGAYYSFHEPQGWNVSEVPKVIPARPPLAGAALEEARLKELDRRIARGPDSDGMHLWVRKQKIGYLVSLNRNRDAWNACREAATAEVRWWLPHYGMALLAEPAQADAAEQEFRKWTLEHANFYNYWHLARFYRERGRHEDALAALRDGVKIPRDQSHEPFMGFWTHDAYPLEGAGYANQQKDHQLTVDLIEWWLSDPARSPRLPNMDGFAFRAAGNLGLGNLHEARQDAATVLEWSTTRYAKPRSVHWVGNLEQLKQACDAGDLKYQYNPGPTFQAMLGNWGWLGFGLYNENF